MIVSNQNLTQPAGDLRTIAALATGVDTELDAFAASTINGSLISWGPTANSFLILKGDTSSPYFKATLYNSSTKTATVLTISGALSGTITSNLSAGLTYSTEQSGWYLKFGGAAASCLVYKLTLSGTTLTVGASFDIDGSFSGNADDILMTGDKTDLYFLDVSDGSLKKYDLSGASMGAALTAPATGYYTTNNTESHFGYSNGKIYFLSATASGGIPTLFQEYNIGGNSWTTKTVPLSMRNVPNNQLTMLCDTDNNTDVYFFVPPIDTTTTPTDGHIIKWTSATDASEIYCFIATLLSGPQTASQGTGMPKYPDNRYAIRAGVLDVSTGDMVFVSGSTNCWDIHNAGTQWARQTIFNYTGSGVLIGLASGLTWYASSGGVSTVFNSALSYAITVDGGTTRIINLGLFNANETGFSLNIPFATSLVIEVLGGIFTQGVTPEVGRTVLANVLINS